MAHIHAQHMLKYAKDALESDTPWKNWQFMKLNDDNWRNCASSPRWDEATQYRQKPKFIVDFDDNLNTAGMEFLDVLHKYEIHYDGRLFNSCKSILREVIQNYISRLSEEDKKKISNG